MEATVATSREQHSEGNQIGCARIKRRIQDNVNQWTNQNNAWQAFHLLRLRHTGFEHYNTGKPLRRVPWNNSSNAYCEKTSVHSFSFPESWSGNLNSHLHWIPHPTGSSMNSSLPESSEMLRNNRKCLQSWIPHSPDVLVRLLVYNTAAWHQFNWRVRSFQKAFKIW